LPTSVKIPLMDKEAKLKLLKTKVEFVNSLLEKVDWEALRQWREETLMILDNLIDEESKYYKNFEKIGYRSGVLSMMDPEGNRRRDEEAYVSGLQKAKSSLNAILYGIEQGLLI